MHINDFDYFLPEELIAQHPADKRDQSRLLVIDRQSGGLEHKHFYNECAKKVIDFCKDRGIVYHIKNKTITEE